MGHILIFPMGSAVGAVVQMPEIEIRYVKRVIFF